MVTLADVRRWRPGTLGDVEADLGRAIDRLVGLQDELDTASTVPGWIGGTAMAARAAAQGLQDRLETLVAGAAAVHDATSHAQHGISALLRRIAAADATAVDAGLDVGATGEVTVPASGTSADAGAVAQRLDGEYQDIVKAAIALDDDYTAALDAAAEGRISADKAGGLTAMLQPPGLAAAAAYGATHIPGAPAPGQPGGPDYVLGSPTRPPITFDEDFPYDPSATPTIGDWLNWKKWGAKAAAARVAKPSWDDASPLYDHYRGGSGNPVDVDYEEAYREDPGVRRTVDGEIASARDWAERIHRSTGLRDFSISGDAHGTADANYPETEDWQKALGAHQVWGSGDVHVSGTRATMTVVVHAADRWNFNRGAHDIGTGTPDNENGRFATLGWARSFDTNGTVTRTVSWELGSSAPPTVTDGGDVTRHAPGEDRVDGSRSGDR